MPKPDSPGHSGSTRTVDRALLLLSKVAEGPTRSTLSQLAHETDLSPSTAYRLLSSLVQHELVQRDETGRYQMGRRMKQLAAASLRDDHLYEMSGPHLEALVEETGETASLGIPLGSDEVLYLRQVASTHQVQSIIWTGRTIPRTGTALGLALSGAQSETGYCVSQRKDSDIVAVAVPIRSHSEHIVGAISINAPAYRTTTEDAIRFGEALLAHGKSLSAQLGHTAI